MNNIYLSTLIPKKHMATMVIKNEKYSKSDLIDMVNWLRVELKIHGKDRIGNDLKGFLKTIPIDSYVFFRVRLVNDHSVLNFGSGMLGFISEHVMDAHDSLEFSEVEEWVVSPSKQQPTMEMLQTHFNLDHLEHISKSEMHTISESEESNTHKKDHHHISKHLKSHKHSPRTPKQQKISKDNHHIVSPQVVGKA